MTKNSTIDMLNYFLKKDSLRDSQKESLLQKNKSHPKKKTINTILAYAKSVQGIKVKESIRGMISLN